VRIIVGNDDNGGKDLELEASLFQHPERLSEAEIRTGGTYIRGHLINNRSEVAELASLEQSGRRVRLLGKTDLRVTHVVLGVASRLHPTLEEHR
jgi:hypothetical protein